MTASDIPVPPRSLWLAIASWVAALLFCAGLWFLRIRSDLDQLNQARNRLEKDRETVETMKREVARSPELERDAVVLQADLYAVTNVHLLTPLLNSYAMRAKELLAEAFGASGFSITDVRERYRIPLPVENWSSDLFFMRVGVEVTGVGSFQEVAEFVAQTETSLPYASVAGLTISQQRTSPLRHRAVVLLEWPAQGPKPLPPPPPRKPERRRTSSKARQASR